MGTAWQLQLLGVPHLRRLGAADSPPEPLARKDAAWLAYAALNKSATSATLALMLWPEVTEPAALNNLRQRIYRLRRATGARLVEMGERIELAPDLSVDTVPLETRLGDDPEVRIEPLLAGFEYDAESEFAAWLTVERQTRAQALRELLARLAAEAEQKGQLVLALRYARRQLSEDTLSEYAHRRLMRLHYLRGDTAAAVAAFEACEAALKEGLGLRPGAETLALLDLVERGQALTPLTPLAPGLPAVSLMRPPRLVGREELLSQLARAESAVTVLVGEAGMGKTRVLQELERGYGAAVLHVQARPGDAGVPYGSLVRLVRALKERVELSDGTALAPLLDEASVPRLRTTVQQLQRALEDLLARAGLAGLTRLLVDDLHFADRASVEMLLELVRSDALQGLRWVLAHRPAAAADADLALLQDLAESPQARWLQVLPLSEPQLQELVDSLGLNGMDPAHGAAALARHTGGNPLFVIETLRASLQGRPQARVLPQPVGLMHLLEQRLRRLSDAALALSRVAAIAVPDFSVALAEQVLGAPALALANAWDELEAAQVLRGTDFAHDLVHDAVLRITPAVLTAHLHGQVAALLLQQGVEPARVAAHWQAAGQPRPAAQAFAAAAQRAQAAGRAREQAQLLLAQADALELAGDVAPARLARLAAVRPLLLGEGAAAALALSERLLPAPADRAAPAAQAWALHALTCLWSGRLADSEEAGRHALALAEPHEELVRMEAARCVAQACGQLGRPEEGLALLAPWEERVASVDDVEQRLDFCGTYVNLKMYTDRPVEAMDWTQRHLRWAEQAGHLSEQVSAHMNLVGHRLRQGDLETGVAHAQAAAALAADAGQLQELAAWNNAVLGYMLCGLGRYADGLTRLESELARTPAGIGALRANLEQWLAQSWLNLGQPARALHVLGGDEAVPPGNWRAKRLIMRARLTQALAGDASPMLDEALAASLKPMHRYDWLQIRLLQAQQAEPDQALRCCEELQPLMAQRQLQGLAAELERVRLRALLLQPTLDAVPTCAGQLEVMALRWRHPMFSPAQQLAQAAQGFSRLDLAADARRCRLAALHWVHLQVFPQVPAAFQDSFLHRSAVTAGLSAAELSVH
ncbi:AAA family ATPase [Paucibacter sp. PLA-PC-4]|uniref:AAA family ATPase n=1 Tax=Paucibacter sp. PLA-PC-4 TaxID=2993655 RepID=UPI00224B591F|nr:AAA family ATPase [Paucibacter sp. PLA-PC-4]MCX2864645.1 AAA family ATPase [Paucibacter sp. PLA-PC-4]